MILALAIGIFILLAVPTMLALHDLVKEENNDEWDGLE